LDPWTSTAQMKTRDGHSSKKKKKEQKKTDLNGREGRHESGGRGGRNRGRGGETTVT